MVRRLIVAAAVAVASLGANADRFIWNYLLDGVSYEARGNSSDRSFYVFVSSESPSGGIKDYGQAFEHGGTAARIQSNTYRVQSKDDALNKIANIIASGKADDLGNLFNGKDVDDSWIGNASFTAFAVLLNAADITKATSYRIFENYAIRKDNRPFWTDLIRFKGSESPFVSLAGDDDVFDVYDVTWGAVAPDPNSSPSGTGRMPAWAESPASSSWLDIATIPEPTSGVMLLLGVAALALKRKK